MINILKHRDENLVRLYKYFLPYKGKIAVASIFLIRLIFSTSLYYMCNLLSAAYTLELHV